MAAIDELLRAYGLQPQLPSGTPGGFRPTLPPGTPGGNPMQPTLPPGTPMPMAGSPPNLNQHHFGSGDNPYADFNTKFGGGRNLYDTPLSEKIGNQNPLTEWTRWTSMTGFGGNNRKGQFGANQFGKFNNALQASLLQNPENTTRSFAKQTDPMAALNDQWLRSSANARGLRPASRASTIRWG